MTDLLTLRDFEPPMGDTAAHGLLALTHAYWTTTLDGEDDAPARRILHARILSLHAPVAVQRVGLRRARGYHKCGSLVDLDRVTAFRVRAWADGAWHVLLDERDAPDPHRGVVWYELGGAETACLMLEVRRSDADGWWPSWNLATGAFSVEAETALTRAPRDERLLAVGRVDLGGLTGGLTATHEHGEVRYRSGKLDVAFPLTRAGMTRLGVTDSERAPDNLLRLSTGVSFQGPMLAPVGAAPVAAPILRWRVDGTAEVADNTVRYTLDLGGLVRYTLAWTVEADGLTLHAVRESDAPLRAITSAAWAFGFDPRVAPAHLVGPLVAEGETGLVAPPAWLDVPGYGSLRIEAEGDVLLRADVIRPEDRTRLEIKVGEVPQPEGDYLLPAGRFEATIRFRLDRLRVPLKDDAPEAVRQAVARCALTALTYRPDTATLTNNGASMHCPLCMDMWAATTTRLGDVLPGFAADELLRTSLERWLHDAPGYASGWLVSKGRRHLAEDEYLMTGTAGLLGLADFLAARGTAAWVDAHHAPIRRQLDRMRARDLDGDGLVESPYRTGVSGTGQWSTCWWDVLSFGWKDAFANALLYPALVRLAGVLPGLGAPDLADGLADWAARLRASYVPAFFNPATGWLGGWRCAEGRLHDHAFLFVTGAATTGGLLDDALARDAVGRLYAELQRTPLPDAALGLPGNLWPVPDEDRADILQGYPLGYYQNGGLTHSQARHFVGALYRVGLTAEADALLERLCAGLADGRVYGGVRSGRDWRYHDGRPCGYEGLLTDQFGVIGLALERWADR
jgi:hypothetical protein